MSVVSDIDWASDSLALGAVEAFSTSILGLGLPAYDAVLNSFLNENWRLQLRSTEAVNLINTIDNIMAPTFRFISSHSLSRE